MAPGGGGAFGGGTASAGGEEGDEGGHVVGDEEEGEHGDDAFESADGENDADERAEKKRNCGRAALVDARNLVEKEAIAAHGIDDAGAHQVQGVDGAKEGDDHDGAKDEIAVAAEDALGGQAEGKIVAGDLVHRKNIEDGGVDEQVDDEERAEAGEDGPA